MGNLAALAHGATVVYPSGAACTPNHPASFPDKPDAALPFVAICEPQTRLPPSVGTLSTFLPPCGADSFDAAATLAAVEAERCTSLYGVPTMFAQAFELPE
jgi:hypothetical protein